MVVNSIEWLRHGLDSGEIPVNQPDARVHLIAGYAFLRVPDVFYLYLKQTGSNHDRRYIQSVFERAGLHRVRSGERFVQARLYDSAERTGRYQPVSGYLVKSRSLFSGMGAPETVRLSHFRDGMLREGMICYGAFMGSKKAGKLTWDELLDEYFSRETCVRIRNGLPQGCPGIC